MTKHGQEWEEWVRTNRPGLLETLDSGIRGSSIQNCERCGRAFKVIASKLIARYCSMVCMREHQKESAHEERTCKTCGSLFDFKTSQGEAYAGAGQFCTRKCAESVPYRCLVCDAPSVGRFGSRYCDSHAGKSYLTLPTLDRRVWSMSSPLRLKDKRQIVRALVDAAIGRPCPYCKKTIDLDSASLDHKTPLSHFWRGTEGKIPIEVRRLADAADNLQIICRSCNGDKGDFTDEEMGVLLALPFWTRIQIRLRASKAFWGKKRAEARALRTSWGA